MPKIDHEFTDVVVCPWCGHTVYDSFEFQNDYGEETCYKCDKEFTYTRYISVEYSTAKKEESSE